MIYRRKFLELEFKLFQFLFQIDSLVSKNSDQQKILINVLVSGGRDSMCLLHALNTVYSSKLFDVKSKFIFIVTHFNHKKRNDESDEDAYFVLNSCLKLGIECYGLNINGSKNKKNFQNFARQQRRILSINLSEQLSEQLCCHKFFIFTAHHAQDHIESVLLHLIRGSGLSGLEGFYHQDENLATFNNLKSKFGGFLKPFSETFDEDMQKYSEKKQIKFRLDSSNLTDDYARNFLRHHVLPKLKTLNTRFDKNILSFSKKIKQINDLMKSSQMQEEFVFSSSTTSFEVYEYLKRKSSFTDALSFQNEHITEHAIENILHEVNLLKKSCKLKNKTIFLKGDKVLILYKKDDHPDKIFVANT